MKHVWRVLIGAVALGIIFGTIRGVITFWGGEAIAAICLGVGGILMCYIFGSVILDITVTELKERSRRETK